jgi:tetratricopeptide (TPR) repeat protein
MEKSDSAKAIISRQRRGQHELALQEFESIRSSLTACEVNEILGNAAFYKRHFQEAISLYERAISKEPGYMIAPYQYLVGFNHVRSGELVDAFKRLQLAIEIDPEFVESYVELGFLLMRVQDFAGAAVCYEDALLIEPNELANYHNVVEAYKRLASADADKYMAKSLRAQKQYDEAKKRLPAANAASMWRADA